MEIEIMLRKFIAGQLVYQTLEPFITANSNSQATASQWLAELALPDYGNMQVLDLGCGEGGSVDLFGRLMPTATWHGVDIECSPEVARRTRQDTKFDTFDGIHLPYRDDFFSLVYCNQVLEHVRHPDRLLPEVKRVLKPGGTFMGAVSYLEPFHSRSIFNLTPYGLQRVLEDAGIELEEIRPGIDAFSLIARQMLGAPRFLNVLFRVSPFHLATGFLGFLMLLPPDMRAFLKIQYSGQICFRGTASAD